MNTINLTFETDENGLAVWRLREPPVFHEGIVNTRITFPAPAESNETWSRHVSFFNLVSPLLNGQVFQDFPEYLEQYLGPFEEPQTASKSLLEKLVFLNETCEATSPCTVCLEKPKEILLVPCCHFCLCGSCFSSVSKCPVCRNEVDQAVFVRNFKCHFCEEKSDLSYCGCNILTCSKCTSCDCSVKLKVFQ